MDELRRALTEKMRGLIPEIVVMGTVTEVDEVNLSITVKQSGIEVDLFDVRLVPGMKTAANTVVCIPKVGSLVLVGIISNIGQANYMIICQECEKIILNGGSFGGIIKIQELQKQMKKDSDILQALLDVIRGVALTQPANAPSVLQAAFKAKMATLLKGDYSDIENKNVTHG